MKTGELARRLMLELRGDSELELNGAAPLEQARAGTLSLVANAKYAPLLEQVAPTCVIAPAELAAGIKCAQLISANPYYDFARALQLLYPDWRPAVGIDPSASIHSSAAIGPEASIGAHVTIGAEVRVGARAVIHPNVTIYPKVVIGDDFVCHSQVSIREGVRIGDRVLLHNGVVLGSDGFGFVEAQGMLVKIPQVGTVVLEDEVEVGANCTIDRATLGATVLCHGVKLDNLVHIAHNCEVGAYSRFAAQAGVAGSVKIGEWCEIGGQTGVADHSQLGKRVRVAGRSGIHNRIADNRTVSGVPAVDIRLWRRQVAALVGLPRLARRVRALEAKLRLAAGHEGQEEGEGEQ